ncbi:hypothetical protein AMAG_09264 [Allomyces macrogynus ATCC 38327]|uniref:Uncharacterized protein n=1 Tax=Allomyces macrogynus (strain ATCC 38327) TaxID=578462 RepID=A0A0L0SNX7_ALLM3|nr:hypothetical protein AMAG_09264 [Allomyces macrogynus ATCC 38327]|eukprot:KNE64223.1 hypothetical protein AMAG_09264 [Allomyces macrogynus ATCC 38327]
MSSPTGPTIPEPTSALSTAIGHHDPPHMTMPHDDGPFVTCLRPPRPPGLPGLAADDENDDATAAAPSSVPRMYTMTLTRKGTLRGPAGDDNDDDDPPPPPIIPCGISSTSDLAAADPAAASAPASPPPPTSPPPSTPSTTATLRKSILRSQTMARTPADPSRSPTPSTRIEFATIKSVGFRAQLVDVREISRTSVAVSDRSRASLDLFATAPRDPKTLFATAVVATDVSDTKDLAWAAVLAGGDGSGSATHGSSPPRGGSSPAGSAPRARSASAPVKPSRPVVVHMLDAAGDGDTVSPDAMSPNGARKRSVWKRFTDKFKPGSKAPGMKSSGSSSSTTGMHAVSVTFVNQSSSAANLKPGLATRSASSNGPVTSKTSAPLVPAAAAGASGGPGR